MKRSVYEAGAHTMNPPPMGRQVLIELLCRGLFSPFACSFNGSRTEGRSFSIFPLRARSVCLPNALGSPPCGASNPPPFGVGPSELSGTYH